MLLSLISCGIFVVLILLSVAFFTLFERNLLSYSQNRLGPNNVGGLGLLQPSFDGIKLLLNENIYPHQVFSLGFHIIPALTFPTMILISCIPSEFYLFNSSLFQSLLFLSLIGVGGLWIILSGILTSSKFSFLGGLRGSAQSVSYEILLSLVLFGIITLCGGITLQNTPFLAFLFLPLWSSGLLAEVARAPLDFTEGESELISGYNTEFSSSLFVLLFLSEYGFILAFAFISTCLFFSNSWLIGGFLSLFVILLRACFPRFRFDILMGICWLYLLPFVIILIVPCIVFILGT